MKTMKTILRHDLLKHFFCGFFIYAGLFALFAIFGMERASFYALLSTAVIGTLKEIVWDGMMRKGQVDGRDAIYTGLPALIVHLLMYFT